jgi:tRNA wybutosine-synthesizing protein 4
MSTVEGTNDYSIVSKLSAASAGYFADEFLAEFVEKPRRRAPLINWGYYLREPINTSEQRKTLGS